MARPCQMICTPWIHERVRTGLQITELKARVAELETDLAREKAETERDQHSAACAELIAQNGARAVENANLHARLAELVDDRNKWKSRAQPTTTKTV